MTNPQTVEIWDVFELSLSGPEDGNPFTDVTLNVHFRHRHRDVAVEGFYDGDGVYKARLMPDALGAWSYVTESNRDALDGVEGELTCVEPAEGNHGPVRVRDTFHFAYEDGTRYVPVGTTCYVWNHQGDALEAQTLTTLASAPFNKMRMCVFPKHYTYNRNEPPYYPFAGEPLKAWDFTRFNPAFFRHLERRVTDLRDLGIEADLILFHPYDRWGFSAMPPEADARYLRYLVARLAAYRNVWWSFANEYDLMQTKTAQDWDRFFKLVQTYDPYQHLRSIHNCREFYDHNKPWVTHCSVQRHDLTQVTRWRELYHKPVVVDECAYEGNIPYNWGNISGRELVHRFWEGFSRGGYVGHGETYVHPEDVLWWSKGGVLHGRSPARIAFLRRIMEEGPDIDPQGASWNLNQSASPDDAYRLIYFGRHQPAHKDLELPEDAAYTVEVIDPWEMTVTPLPGTYTGACRVELPGKPYLALRIRRE